MVPSLALFLSPVNIRGAAPAKEGTKFSSPIYARGHRRCAGSNSNVQDSSEMFWGMGIFASIGSTGGDVPSKELGQW